MSPESIQKLRQAEVWIFDLDNTLYPADCNLFSQMDVKMGTFISEFLTVDYAQAKIIQKEYFHEHGTTLSGLMHHYNLPPEQFLDYVHDIDYSPVISDEQLNQALDKLTGRKYIFTNGTVSHADSVLARLGVGHHFEDIFDIVASDYIPKPQAAPYEKFVSDHNIRPETAVMVEDMANNLTHPAVMGMQTVWVRTDSDWAQNGSDGDHIHHRTDDLSKWLADVTS